MISEFLFDKSFVSVSSASDLGAYHRALIVARMLGESGLWDGKCKLEICGDVYVLHSRLTLGYLSVHQLVLGVDYKVDVLTSICLMCGKQVLGQRSTCSDRCRKAKSRRKEKINRYASQIRDHLLVLNSISQKFPDLTDFIADAISASIRDGGVASHEM